MTIVVTRSVKGRTRGFLASCMCEVAPGVYTADLAKRVRERVVQVLEQWHPLGGEESVVVIWRDPHHPGGQQIMALGLPPYEVIPWDGTLLVRRDLTPKEELSLTTKDEEPR